MRCLGLILVDEEHDGSFKQEEGVRYHARDMAIVLAALHGAKTLLGSATPSLESQYNAHSGKYAYAELLTRYGDVAMPAITLVDLRDAQRRKQMRGHFSQPLIDATLSADTPDVRAQRLLPDGTTAVVIDTWAERSTTLPPPDGRELAMMVRWRFTGARGEDCL